MKKLIMLAAVLLGTAAASQAGIDIRIGLPLPPLPRVIFGHPAPVVVLPGHCAPVYGYNYGYPPHSHGYYRHGNHGHDRYSHGYRSHDRDYSRGRDSSRSGRHGHR